MSASKAKKAGGVGVRSSPLPSVASPVPGAGQGRTPTRAGYASPIGKMALSSICTIAYREFDLLEAVSGPLPHLYAAPPMASMSPLQMTASRLVPNEHILICRDPQGHTGGTADELGCASLPIWFGNVWPLKRSEGGKVQIPLPTLQWRQAVDTGKWDADVPSGEADVAVFYRLLDPLDVSGVGITTRLDAPEGSEHQRFRVIPATKVFIEFQIASDPVQSARQRGVMQTLIGTLNRASASASHNLKAEDRHTGLPTEAGAALAVFLNTIGRPLLLGLCLDISQRTILTFGGLDVSVCGKPPVSGGLSGLAESDTRDVYYVARSTIFSVAESKIEDASTTPEGKDIPMGGYYDLKDRLLDLIRARFDDSRSYKDKRLRPPRGALLAGPPGTGKTLMARKLASELRCSFFTINGPELISSVVGQTEEQLKAVFSRASERQPAIIFIDEMDGLCPRREGASEAEVRIVSTMLCLLDGITSSSTANDHVFVLGATNRPAAIDPALRRPGRFDEELTLGVPNEADRAEILRACLSTYPHSIAQADLVAVASRAHGYVGADIAGLCREAALACVRRCAASSDAMEPILTLTDLKEGLQRVQPSAIREITVEVPNVRWEDIGGQKEAKQLLKEAVEWPLTHPEAFVRMGIRPPKGVLLYGPPGCSKTMMAKAMATESHMNFLAVKGPELFSKYVGDSEKAVAEIFHKARGAAPCIIFFDEFDALASTRSGGDEGGGSSVGTRVVSQLLAELDGITALKQVVVVAATNRPDLIDGAVLRPGRLDRMLYIGPPDDEARRAIIVQQIRRVPSDKEIDVEALMAATEGYSGAEIVGIFRDACVRAVQSNVADPRLEMAHVTAAIEAMPRQITPDMLAFYQRFMGK